jgi:hypothetical protein
LQTCSVCNKQSPDDAQTCPRCGSDLSHLSTVAVARSRLQANPRVSLIRVSVGDDCCPACAAAQGAHPKHDVPVLPIEGCSGAHGCRCYYEPVLTEIYP